jgi:uncharacterized protein (TIGR03084 family)
MRRLFGHTATVSARQGATTGDGRRPVTSTIFDDLAAEEELLETVLSGLPEQAWRSASSADGWTVADVVLHLAQTEEAVLVAAAGDPPSPDWRSRTGGVDEVMDAMVRAERVTPEEIFRRWRTARRLALTALRQAEPQRAVPWVAASLKPRTLATTRLAEHWAHALDITGPLGIDYPDSMRLRHVAWLGHSTLPYAFALAGQQPHDLYCELTAPDNTIWRFGPPDADSSITGPAGAFCRLGARRLTPEESGLVAAGPHGPAALLVLRNYAG